MSSKKCSRRFPNVSASFIGVTLSCPDCGYFRTYAIPPEIEYQGFCYNESRMIEIRHIPPEKILINLEAIVNDFFEIGHEKFKDLGLK